MERDAFLVSFFGLGALVYSKLHGALAMTEFGPRPSRRAVGQVGLRFPTEFDGVFGEYNSATPQEKQAREKRFGAFVKAAVDRQALDVDAVSGPRASSGKAPEKSDPGAHNSECAYDGLPASQAWWVVRYTTKKLEPLRGEPAHQPLSFELEGTSADGQRVFLRGPVGSVQVEASKDITGSSSKDDAAWVLRADLIDTNWRNGRVGELHRIRMAQDTTQCVTAMLLDASTAAPLPVYITRFALGLHADRVRASSVARSTPVSRVDFYPARDQLISRALRAMTHVDPRIVYTSPGADSVLVGAHAVDGCLPLALVVTPALGKVGSGSVSYHPVLRVLVKYGTRAPPLPGDLNPDPAPIKSLSFMLQGGKQLGQIATSSSKQLKWAYDGVLIPKETSVDLVFVDGPAPKTSLPLEPPVKLPKPAGQANGTISFAPFESARYGGGARISYTGPGEGSRNRWDDLRVSYTVVDADEMRNAAIGAAVAAGLLLVLGHFVVRPAAAGPLFLGAALVAGVAGVAAAVVAVSAARGNPLGLDAGRFRNAAVLRFFAACAVAVLGVSIVSFRTGQQLGPFCTAAVLLCLAGAAADALTFDEGGAVSAEHAGVRAVAFALCALGMFFVCADCLRIARRARTPAAPAEKLWVPRPSAPAIILVAVFGIVAYGAHTITRHSRLDACAAAENSGVPCAAEGARWFAMDGPGKRVFFPAVVCAVAAIPFVLAPFTGYALSSKLGVLEAEIRLLRHSRLASAGPDDAAPEPSANPSVPEEVREVVGQNQKGAFRKFVRAGLALGIVGYVAWVVAGRAERVNGDHCTRLRDRDAQHKESARTAGFFVGDEGADVRREHALYGCSTRETRCAALVAGLGATVVLLSFRKQRKQRWLSLPRVAVDAAALAAAVFVLVWVPGRTDEIRQVLL